MNATERHGQRNTELVAAAVRENIWAGVGAGSVVLAGEGAYCFYAGTPFADWHLVPPLFVGLSMFGVLSVIRFSLDEWRDGLDRAKMMGVLVQYRADNERLAAENADLRSENKRLRQHARGLEFQQASKDARAVAPTPSYADEALRHAERVLQLWASGVSYARDKADMTEGEWQAAFDLLQSAGVAGRGGKGGRQRIIIATSHSEALMLVRKRAGVWQAAEGTTFTPA